MHGDIPHFLLGFVGFLTADEETQRFISCEKLAYFYGIFFLTMILLFSLGANPTFTIYVTIFACFLSFPYI